MSRYPKQVSIKNGHGSKTCMYTLHSSMAKQLKPVTDRQFCPRFSHVSKPTSVFQIKREIILQWSGIESLD